MGKLLNLQCELREYDKGIRGNVIRQRNIGVNSSKNKVTRRSKETTKRRLKGYRENGTEVLRFENTTFTQVNLKRKDFPVIFYPTTKKG